MRPSFLKPASDGIDDGKVFRVNNTFEGNRTTGEDTPITAEPRRFT
jgi:hypothetical protein